MIKSEKKLQGKRPMKNKTFKSDGHKKPLNFDALIRKTSLTVNFVSFIMTRLAERVIQDTTHRYKQPYSSIKMTKMGSEYTVKEGIKILVPKKTIKRIIPNKNELKKIKLKPNTRVQM